MPGAEYLTAAKLLDLAHLETLVLRIGSLWIYSFH